MPLFANDANFQLVRRGTISAAVSALVILVLLLGSGRCRRLLHLLLSSGTINPLARKVVNLRHQALPYVVVHVVEVEVDAILNRAFSTSWEISRSVFRASFTVGLLIPSGGTSRSLGKYLSVRPLDTCGRPSHPTCEKPELGYPEPPSNCEGQTDQLLLINGL